MLDKAIHTISIFPSKGLTKESKKDNTKSKANPNKEVIAKELFFK